MARQHTQRAAHRTSCGPTVQISSQRTSGLHICWNKSNGLSRVGCNVGGLLQALNKAENNSRTHGSASGYLGQPATRTDRQGCERLIKLSDRRLVLELGAVSGHFVHSHWQWNSGIRSFVNCVVSTMLLHWCSSLNILNAEKLVGGHVKKSTTLSFFNGNKFCLVVKCRRFH